MRIRTIKPEFWTSQDIADLPDDIDRLLFIGLWNYADDEGRGRDNPRLICAALFPLRDEIEAYMVDSMMWGLQDAGLITRYIVQGDTFYCVNTWTDHQRVNRPSPSKFPPVNDGSVRTHDLLSETSITVDNGELEDSLPEGNREQGSGREQGTGNHALRAVPDNRPDPDQLYLVGRIWEQWGKDIDEDGAVKVAQKLNSRYGRVSVTDALRQLHGFPPEEAVRSPYAYLTTICKQAVSA